MVKDFDALKDAFSKEFMMELVFINQIYQNVGNMFEHLPNPKSLQVNVPRDMKFQVVRRSETDYPEIILSPDAVFFISAMAKAISDVILKELVPKMHPETKKCSSCTTINNKIAKYCYQCGKTEFE